MPSDTRLRAIFVLILVTILWAWGFIWTKQALDAAATVFSRDGLEGWTVTGLFLFMRFGISMLCLPIVMPRTMRGLNWEYWRDGFLLAFLLGVGFFTQTQGLQNVNPAVSAFLTSLYVVFTALIGWLVLGHSHSRYIMLGVLMATFGAGFISGPPQLNFNLPEWLTVICALFYALHILAIDYFTKERKLDAIKLTLCCLVWVTAFSGIIMFGGVYLGVDAKRLIGVAMHPGFFMPSLWCALFVTAFALAAMNAWQKHVAPVRAAIIYSLEPVWAILLMVILGFGGLDKWAIIGGGTLLAGNLIAEIKR